MLAFLIHVMKLFGVSILSSIILLVNAQFGLQLAIYEIFKPNIIETFCINKDVEGSDCEAMCKMSEMAQEDADTQNHPKSPLEQDVQIKFFEQNISISVATETIPFEVEKTEMPSFYTCRLLDHHLGVLSPPPQA